MVRFTNQILNNLANSENDEFVVAGDTDSIFSEAKVRLKNVKDILKILLVNKSGKLVYRNR